jgi:hypothetical protein
LATNAGAVAMPLAFVGAAALLEPENVPVAPLAGAVNVTTTPLTGFPDASFTVACKGVANAVFTLVLCGLPAVAAIDDAPPPVFVSAKAAAAATPGTLAEMV